MVIVQRMKHGKTHTKNYKKKMTQETQQQKAIKIAIKDEWESYESKDKKIRYKRDKTFGSADADWILLKYTTDLNYLMPLAVKVLKEKRNVNEFKTAYLDFAMMPLKFAVDDLKCDANGQYTELFEALFNAITLLEHE
jgi:hypothetical protein